jgi:hypothetical protein
MRIAAALVLVVAGLASQSWAGTARVSTQQLSAAVNAASSEAVPYRHGTLSPTHVRRVRCVGPDEEPTEFRCTWQQRTHEGWRNRETWLALDGRGWKVID